MGSLLFIALVSLRSTASRRAEGAVSIMVLVFPDVVDRLEAVATPVGSLMLARQWGPWRALPTVLVFLELRS